MDFLNKIYNEDCIETMKRIPDDSIDLMLTDTPYNVTSADWDNSLDLPLLWNEWNRICKIDAAMIFTATQPFSSELIISNKSNFKYEWIWQKSQPTGFILADKRPLNYHEHILVFYRKQPTYNPIMVKGLVNHGDNNYKTDKIKSSISTAMGSKMQYKKADKSGLKYPASIIKINCVDRAKVEHPTQKPIDLFRYLIKTYTNEHETVFDGYMGSGTTAMACIAEKRNFVGSELNKEYFELATKRIETELLQPKLF